MTVERQLAEDRKQAEAIEMRIMEQERNIIEQKECEAETVSKELQHIKKIAGELWFEERRPAKAAPPFRPHSVIQTKTDPHRTEESQLPREHLEKEERLTRKNEAEAKAREDALIQADMRAREELLHVAKAELARQREIMKQIMTAERRVAEERIQAVDIRMRIAEQEAIISEEGQLQAERLRRAQQRIVKVAEEQKQQPVPGPGDHCPISHPDLTTSQHTLSLVDTAVMTGNHSDILSVSPEGVQRVVDAIHEVRCSESLVTTNSSSLLCGSRLDIFVERSEES